MSKKLILFIPLLNAKLQTTIILDDKLLDYVDGGVLKNLLEGLYPANGEARGVLCTLELDLSRGWTKISYCSSSLVSFGALLDSCLLLRSNFDVLSFHFVKRVGNSLAHALASNASLSGLEGPSLPSEVCCTN